MIEVQGFIPAYSVRNLLAGGLIQYLPRVHRLEVTLFIRQKQNDKLTDPELNNVANACNDSKYLSQLIFFFFAYWLLLKIDFLWIHTHTYTTWACFHDCPEENLFLSIHHVHMA